MHGIFAFSLYLESKMPNSTLSPLTDLELAELDAFLISDACDEDALPIDEAHGFLTAMLIAENDEMERGTWHEAIWGQPAFADEAQKQHMSELLDRLLSDVAASLEHRGTFEPLVVEIEEEGLTIESYEGWCFGFMLGLEQWGEWLDEADEAQDLVIPMAQLALLMEDDAEEMGDEEYDQWVELLPGAVSALYALKHPL